MHNKVVAIVHWCIVLHIYRALIDWMSWNQNQSNHGDKIIKKKRKKPVRTQNKKHNGSKKSKLPKTRKRGRSSRDLFQFCNWLVKRLAQIFWTTITERSKSKPALQSRIHFRHNWKLIHGEYGIATKISMWFEII